MEIEMDKLTSILKEKKELTATQAAEELGITINSENRKMVLSKIRAALRKVVDVHGGDRSGRSKDGQQLYELR
jgi:hypothetical protein